MTVQEIIVKALLEILMQFAGNPVKEKTVLLHVTIELDDVASQDDIKQHLQHCYDKGWVDFVLGGIARDKKWFITDAGKVVLR